MQYSRVDWENSKSNFQEPRIKYLHGGNGGDKSQKVITSRAREGNQISADRGGLKLYPLTLDKNSECKGCKEYEEYKLTMQKEIYRLQVINLNI